jgi:hypothetical protein
MQQPEILILAIENHPASPLRETFDLSHPMQAVDSSDAIKTMIVK